jgi:2C-methyl-D-erythritol 2,4-cyclodiphosphate synthase
MPSPIDKVLSRLERVKRTGDGRYMAASPARKDRTPSLSIRELSDGRVLLHDFGGSTLEQLLSAMGLDIGDLFPDTPTQHTSARRERIAAPHELLALAAFEASVVAVIAADMLRGQPIDADRLTAAAARLGDMVQATRQQAWR